MNYKDEDVFNRSFRKLLLDLRKNMLCSQTALSKCVGVTRQAISMMECGKRMPSLQGFCELAQGVGLSPTQLMNCLERICENESRARVTDVRSANMAMEYVKNAKRIWKRMNLFNFETFACECFIFKRVEWRFWRLKGSFYPIFLVFSFSLCKNRAENGFGTPFANNRANKK